MYIPGYRGLQDGDYNARIKVFNDGTKQISYFPNKRNKYHDEALGRLSKKRDNLTSDVKNRNQSLERVFDICRCNNFDWFVTFTFSEDSMVNRYDYDEYCNLMKSYTQKLRRLGLKYVIVPELHPTSGAIHAHGMIQGDLPVVRAIHPHTGKEMVDRKGRPLYNIVGYDYGFTSASRPDSPGACATYISAYISKSIEWIPKGKKCYWASKSLFRPIVYNEYMDESEFKSFADKAEYLTMYQSPIGAYRFAEKEGERTLEVNKIKKRGQKIVPDPVGFADFD